MNTFYTSRSNASLARSQQGMVSIMVTMTLIIVLSLIVLAFAQISRRNQRETLDQQLSTQAFYAAESGINDASQLINNTLSTGGTVYAKPTCAAPATPAAAAFYSNLPSSTVDAAANVSYSCLMVDPTPTSLDYGDVGTDPIVAPLTTTTGLNFSSIKLTWKTKTGSATPLTGCPVGMVKELPTSANWTTCGYGVLRFDLVPTAAGGLDANGLAAATMTSFVVPLQSGGTAATNFAADATNPNDAMGGSCTNTSCSLTITFPVPVSGQYYIRVGSLYRDAVLDITGVDTSGKAVNFTGAQLSVDATGKAQDVLRRIEVRVSTNGTNPSSLPYYALGSGTSVCKQFAAIGSTGSGFFTNLLSNKPADGASNQLCH